MQSVKNPNQPCSIITSRQFSLLSRVLAKDSTNTTRRGTCYRIIIKRSPSYAHGGQMTDSGKNLRNYSLEREIKARKVKVIEVKGYNSKNSCSKQGLERRSPKTRPVLSRLRPTVNLALIPLYNTRFIKGHKPSNHIRARIKSHVYTTE